MNPLSKHKSTQSELSLQTDPPLSPKTFTNPTKTISNTSNPSKTNFQQNLFKETYHYPKKIILKKHPQFNNTSSNTNSTLHTNDMNPLLKKQTILSKIILLKHNERKENINKGNFIYKRKKSKDKCIYTSYKKKVNRTYEDESGNENKDDYCLNKITCGNINSSLKEYNKCALINKKMQIQTNEMFSIESKENNNNSINVQRNQNSNKTCFTNLCESNKNFELNKTHLRTKTPSSMATTPKDLLKTIDQYSNNKNNNISLNTSSTQTPRYTLHKVPTNIDYLHENDNSSSLSSCILTPLHNEQHISSITNTSFKTNNHSIYNSFHTNNPIITTSNTYGKNTHSSLMRLSVPMNIIPNANNGRKMSSVILSTRTGEDTIKQNGNNNINSCSNSDFIKLLRKKLSSHTSLYENKRNLNTNQINPKQRSVSNYTSNENIHSCRETNNNKITYNPSNYYIENENIVSCVKNGLYTNNNKNNLEQRRGNTNYCIESKIRPVIKKDIDNKSNLIINSYSQYMNNKNKIDKKHRDSNSFIINQHKRGKLSSYLDNGGDIQNNGKILNKYSFSFINNIYCHSSTLTGSNLIYDYDIIGKELYST